MTNPMLSYWLKRHAHFLFLLLSLDLLSLYGLLLWAEVYGLFFFCKPVSVSLALPTFLMVIVIIVIVGLEKTIFSVGLTLKVGISHSIFRSCSITTVTIVVFSSIQSRYSLRFL